MNFNAVTYNAVVIQLIGDLDAFNGSWQHIKTLTPERLSALRQVATIESVGSSTRIEGVKLSDDEVRALLSQLKTYSFRTRDEEEVAGYAAVMEEIFESYDIIPLTEGYICQLQGMLLQFSSKDQHHRGQYKTTTNHVEAFDAAGKSLGVVFQTASPFETPMRMRELVDWARRTLDERTLHPILVAGIFKVVFLAIHPFQDGNGRLSRILSTLILLRAGYSYVPYSSLERIIEENKEQYYLALRETQKDMFVGEPNWNSWLIFFLRALKIQKDRLAHKIKQEQIMLDEQPAQSLKIIELLHQHGRLSTANLEQLTGFPRRTVSAHLAQLVAAGRVKRHGKARATWYTLA